MAGVLISMITPSRGAAAAMISREREGGGEGEGGRGGTESRALFMASIV